jgi:hypothetical protein
MCVDDRVVFDTRMEILAHKVKFLEKERTTVSLVYHMKIL